MTEADMHSMKDLIALMQPRYPELENPDPPRFMCGALLPEVRETELSGHITGQGGNPSPLAENAGFPNGV